MEPQCADPVGLLHFTETLFETVMVMVGLYVGFGLLAFLILFCLSKSVQ